MWKKAESTIGILALVAFGITAFLTLINFHKWWNTSPTPEAIYTEGVLERVKGGDLVLCATNLEDSEDGSKTAMVIEIALAVDIHRPISQELEGKILGKGSQKSITKKYADLEVCEWVDIIKEEKEKEEVKNNILARGTPAGAVFSNQTSSYRIF